MVCTDIKLISYNLRVLGILFLKKFKMTVHIYFRVTFFGLKIAKFEQVSP